MPLGGHLQRLTRHEDTLVQEILYGHGHSKRSARCFVFMLEDRAATTPADNGASGPNEEQGSERLYGICVLHPRLLSATVGASGSIQSQARDATGISFTQQSLKLSYDFESPVCYAFLTRFPLFDFFFQVMFDMITIERVRNMRLCRATDMLAFIRVFVRYVCKLWNV